MRILRDVFMQEGEDNKYQITLAISKQELDDIRNTTERPYRHVTYYTTNNSVIKREVLSIRAFPQKDDIITIDDKYYRVLYRKWNQGGIYKIVVKEHVEI